MAHSNKSDPGRSYFLLKVAEINDEEFMLNELRSLSNGREVALLELLAGMKDKGQLRYKLAEIFLSNGADPNVKDNEGKSSLWHLVRNGNLEIVKLVSKFKADFNCTYKDGTSLLIPAVFNVNNLDVLKYLVQDVGLDVNHRDYNGFTPLRFAALNNQIDSSYEVIKFLLESGADPNASDVLFGKTPLFNLVKDGNLKIFELFFKHNADVYSLDRQGQNILSKFYHLNSDLQVLEKLIRDFKLDVNHKDKFECTPLHHMFNNLESKQINMKVIKCLLVNGANINAPDRDGDTPFFTLIRQICENNQYVKREYFDFFIEQFDFSIIHGKDKRVLDHKDSPDHLWMRILERLTKLKFLTGKGKHVLDHKDSPDYLWMWILEHLAKLKFLTISIHPIIIKFIQDHSDHKKYFNKCIEELEAMNKIKPQNSCISYFNLLIDSRRKLKKYAGNQDLIQDFENSDWLKMFPIYGASLKKKMEKGLKRRELFDKSSILLSDCLPIFNPDHIIFNDILDCILSKKNLSNFCEKLV